MVKHLILPLIAIHIFNLTVCNCLLNRDTIAFHEETLNCCINVVFSPSLLTSADTVPVTLSAGLENVSKFLYTVPTVSSSFGVVQKRQIVQISAIYTVSIACDSDNMRPRYHWRIFGKLFLLLQNLVLENLKFF